MTGIDKAFPGVKALDGAEFTLNPGEVHALLGINGAGKSTLIKVLSGVYSKDSGDILLDGQQIQIEKPQDAMDHGIATVYQDPQMIPSFSGYENIYLGFETDKGGPFNRIDRKGLRRKAEELLARFPVEVDLAKPVSELGAVEREIVAILRAISRDMSILVLDEPTSILTETETQVLFELIDMLKEGGVSVIYITHRLEEVYQKADRLTVFREGKNVATLTADDQNADPMAIAELMLGKKIEKIYPSKSSQAGEVVFEAMDLSLQSRFEDVSFQAKKGEILGIFGLVGSGVDELSKVLFGIHPKSSGQIRIKGQPAEFISPSEAIKEGVFLVPGNRRTEGQIGDQPVFFNMSLANLKKITAGLGLIRRKEERLSIQDLMESLEVSPPDMDQKVSLLSGGNQQKVVIGKGLFAEAAVYIFAEPTVGVDVGAKAGIYNLIRELSKGTAVILISSDCEEVYGMSDRTIAMYKGRITLDRPTDQCTLNEILYCGVTEGNNSGH